MARPAAVSIPRLDDPRSPIVLGAALLAVIVYVAAIVAGVKPLALTAKPLPALMMVFWVWPSDRNRYARAIGAGLAVSAIADLVIELPNGFLGGVALFLAAHVAYIVAFATASRALRPVLLAFFVTWGVVMFSLVRPGLGDMTAPVVVYSIVLCTMMWRAAALVGNPRFTGARATAVVVGALLFGLSDTLIAVDKWYHRIPLAAFLIMSLYWLGQLGIARSARQ